MFKRTAFLGLVCYFLCFPSAWAWDESNLTQTYTSALNPHDLAVVHGYYPKQFSPDTEPNYWITPEEAGHYILGRSRQDYHPSQAARVPAPTTGIIADPTRVLIAPARIQSIHEPEAPTPDYTNRPSRMNDSRDLPEIIKKHAWVTPFNL